MFLVFWEIAILHASYGVLVEVELSMKKAKGRVLDANHAIVEEEGLVAVQKGLFQKDLEWLSQNLRNNGIDKVLFANGLCLNPVKRCKSCAYVYTCI